MNMFYRANLLIDENMQEVNNKLNNIKTPEYRLCCIFRSIIERLNKEFKRRTKPMEIVAGENACYRLLAFISLKMELHWRSNPVGKMRNNLPFFKELAYEKFTQKN